MPLLQLYLESEVLHSDWLEEVFAKIAQMKPWKRLLTDPFLFVQTHYVLSQAALGRHVSSGIQIWTMASAIRRFDGSVLVFRR